ncbi:MAG: prolyl oligopeptidase family serine peptidase [Saprospiraceae bacterium]|nr:prolyl oligopeptidase family serine peptidase [Saprospiraceae bacterium]
MILLAAVCHYGLSQTRGMRVDDLLRLEDLSGMAIDPRGRYFAYVVKRAKADHEYYQRDYLDHNGRADIWLYDLEEERRHNLTQGIEEAEGYWNPVWSPEGRYLAMLSTRGNDNVRLYVWDRQTSELRKLSERGINTRTKAHGKKYPFTFLNLLPLSERGYLILIPSMPSKRSGGSKDDFLEMSKGVLPGVNALISMGIADPDRVAVGGQSYGGYSVYSLLAQTNRFKTAFVLAGLSDLLSLYGKIDMRFRYAEVPYEHTFMPRTLETGQSALGGTPWTNTLRYLSVH